MGRKTGKTESPDRTAPRPRPWRLPEAPCSLSPVGERAGGLGANVARGFRSVGRGRLAVRAVGFSFCVCGYAANTENGLTESTKPKKRGGRTPQKTRQAKKRERARKPRPAKEQTKTAEQEAENQEGHKPPRQTKQSGQQTPTGTGRADPSPKNRQTPTTDSAAQKANQRRQAEREQESGARAEQSGGGQRRNRQTPEPENGSNGKNGKNGKNPKRTAESGKPKTQPKGQRKRKQNQRKTTERTATTKETPPKKNSRANERDPPPEALTETAPQRQCPLPTVGRRTRTNQPKHTQRGGGCGACAGRYNEKIRRRALW